MNDGMNKITLLDPCRKQEFLRPANRLIEAKVKQHRTYHERPIQRDMFAEYDAIAAWGTVTCCYSGIEQAMKCLLQMQGTYVDKSLRQGGHKHHDIGKLFTDLTSDEQDVLRTYYAIYRSLHDYIPPETVDCFFKGIDDGYPTWRYFLLEGNDQNKWPPTTHSGAMLEIWSALTDILRARTFTNDGLNTVKQRLDSYLRRLHIDAFHQPSATLEQINSIARWIKSDNFVDINHYVDLFYCDAKSQPLRLKAPPSTLPQVLTTSLVLRPFVDNVKKDKTDSDFSFFLNRAQTSGIVWNPHEDRFETVSK